MFCRRVGSSNLVPQNTIRLELFMQFFKHSLVVAAFSVSLLGSSGVAEAGGKPKNTKNADPKVIIKYYSNKSIDWSSGGGIFYAPDGQALTIWPSKDKSGSEYLVGVGKWSVTTKGTMCQKVTWNFLKDGKPAKKEGDSRCREHVVDETGVIWVRESKPKRKEWWKLIGSSENSETNRYKKGNKFKSVMKKNAKQIGLKL